MLQIVQLQLQRINDKSNKEIVYNRSSHANYCREITTRNML